MSHNRRRRNAMTDARSQGASGSKAETTLDRVADTAGKMDKIWSLGAKVGTAAIAGLVLAYTWLAKQVVILPRPWLQAIIGSLAALGFVAWAVASGLRRRLGAWTALALACAGGAAMSVAAAIWWLLPAAPTWQRVNAFEVQNAPKVDLPLLLLRSELNSLAPGGGTYEALLKQKLGAATPQQPWAAFYLPLAVSSTMPSKVSVRRPGPLADQASVGVYVVVWTLGSKGITASAPIPFGFEALNDSVALNVPLGPTERAALVVFVFPWTEKAALPLPKTFEEALSME
jgi:hypothetical protein